MTGHGGRRPGAGRKGGGRNTRTREIADRLALEGVTPLEVMIEAMRAHYNAKRLNEAAAIAKDAAPYMHPRLATVNVGNKDGEAFKTQEVGARDLLSSRLAMLASREEAGAIKGMPNGHANGGSSPHNS